MARRVAPTESDSRLLRGGCVFDSSSRPTRVCRHSSLRQYPTPPTRPHRGGGPTCSTPPTRHLQRSISKISATRPTRQTPRFCRTKSPPAAVARAWAGSVRPPSPSSTRGLLTPASIVALATRLVVFVGARSREDVMRRSGIHGSWSGVHLPICWPCTTHGAPAHGAIFTGLHAPGTSGFRPRDTSGCNIRRGCSVPSDRHQRHPRHWRRHQRQWHQATTVY